MRVRVYVAEYECRSEAHIQVVCVYACISTIVTTNTASAHSLRNLEHYGQYVITANYMGDFLSLSASLFLRVAMTNEFITPVRNAPVNLFRMTLQRSSNANFLSMGNCGCGKTIAQERS